MTTGHGLSLKFSKNLYVFASGRENKRMKYNSRSIHLNKILKRYETQRKVKRKIATDPSLYRQIVLDLFHPKSFCLNNFVHNYFVFDFGVFSLFFCLSFLYNSVFSKSVNQI